jgi:hypothetical protein
LGREESVPGSCERKFGQKNSGVMNINTPYHAKV